MATVTQGSESGDLVKRNRWEVETPDFRGDTGWAWAMNEISGLSEQNTLVVDE